MKSTTSAAMIRTVLGAIFLTAFVVAGSLFFLFQYRYALGNSAARARGLLAIADQIRTYTAAHLDPILETPGADFHSESIPAFAVQTILRQTKSAEIPFDYRERMLDPTNPLDRADGFETALIARFRADRGTTELSGTQSKGSGTVFYIAHPIVITNPACIACHSTPEAAPKSVTAKFGTQNGFGWSLNVPLGVQVIEVPVKDELGKSLAIFIVTFAGLAVTMVACYLATTRLLDHNLLSPLRHLADEAERQSRTAAAPMPAARSRLRELNALSAAFERLRVSALLGRQTSPTDQTGMPG